MQRPLLPYLELPNAFLIVDERDVARLRTTLTQRGENAIPAFSLSAVHSYLFE